MATAKEIWDTLSKINVNEHTEKKGNLTYLSWAWAWGELMKHYPESYYVFDKTTDAQGSTHDAMYYPDGSASVSCVVVIGDVERSMSLPVMDNRNNAVIDPNARQISDTKMRCLVKCIAMFGLGHYIYAGEDLPETDKKDFGPAGVGETLDQQAEPKKVSSAQLKKEGGEWDEFCERLERFKTPDDLQYLDEYKAEMREKVKGWPKTYQVEVGEAFKAKTAELHAMHQLNVSNQAAQ